MHIPVLVFLLSFAQGFAHTPLELVSQMHPAPVVVIPDESYRELGEQVAEKIASARSSRDYTLELHALENTGLLGDGVNISSGDLKRYLIHSRGASAPWNPDREGAGIRSSHDGYVVYNDFYVSKFSKESVSLTPVYYVPDVDTRTGRTITIKGKKYLVTEYSAEERYVKLAAAEEVRLYNFSKPFRYSLGRDTSIMLASYVSDNGNKSAILAILNRSTVVASVFVEFSDSLPLDITEELGEFFPCCRVYITEAGDRYLTVVIADKNAEVLTHGQPAFGYTAVWLPGAVDEHRDSLVFLGRSIALGRYDVKPLPGTPYLIRMSDFRISIVRDVIYGRFEPEDTVDSRVLLLYELNVSLMDGRRINITYMSEDLDGRENGDDFEEGECRAGSLVLNGSDSDGWMQEKSLESGYAVYNDLFVRRCSGGYAEVVPVMVFNISRGEIVQIRGGKFMVLDVGDSEVTFMPVRIVRLYRYSHASVLTGLKGLVEGIRVKLAELEADNSPSFELMVFRGRMHVTDLEFRDMRRGEELMALMPYTGRLRVFLAGWGERYIDLAIQMGEPLEVAEGDAWQGYSRLSFMDEHRAFLAGERLILQDGELERVGDTSYYVVYRHGRLDVVRQRSRVVNAGEVLFADAERWRGVLKRDIWFGVRVRERSPVVRVVLLDDVGEENMVLLGTPQDNSLLRALMYYNVSAVDWYSSRGDVEVVRLEPGVSVVILGGSDEVAVRRAVERFMRGEGMVQEKEGVDVSISVDASVVGNLTQNVSYDANDSGSYRRGIVERFMRRIAEFIAGLLGGAG